MKTFKALLLAIFLVLTLQPAQARKKPVIGIAPGYRGADQSTVGRTYTDAVIRAGGIPLILPQADDDATASEIVGRLDGILFTGGVDINPAYYGEEVLNETVEIDGHRDTLDVRYARAALGRKIPILAICRGEQMLNVVLGGSLYQDLPSQKPGPVAHRQSEDGKVPTHRIMVEKGSMLARIMGGEELRVNSFHHQAVKVPSGKVVVTALSEDGVVEAYEGTGKGQWLLAVQFHPEMLVRADDSWLALFKAFVKASR